MRGKKKRRRGKRERTRESKGGEYFFFFLFCFAWLRYVATWKNSGCDMSQRLYFNQKRAPNKAKTVWILSFGRGPFGSILPRLF